MKCFNKINKQQHFFPTALLFVSHNSYFQLINDFSEVYHQKDYKI